MRHRSAFVGLILMAVGAVMAPLHATAESQRPFIPDLFDPHHRVAPAGLETVKTIRFLTTDDFPPFHFAMPDGTLAGFDIDLARAICTDLKLACTIQARRFDTLIAQIKAGNDDALIAAVADTPRTQADLSFTAPYYTTPARFAVRTADANAPATPEALAGKTVGVVAGTAHEAFLRAFFAKAKLNTFPTSAALRAALKGKAVDAIFGDAIALAIWLNGTDANGCCAFRGGPFTESRYFGNGVAIAVGKDNVVLRQALDFELAKLSQDGTWADLYLKYFPIGFY